MTTQAQGFLVNAMANTVKHSPRWSLEVSHEQKEVARTFHQVYFENMLPGPRGESERDRMIRENTQELTLELLDILVERFADNFDTALFPRNEWVKECMGETHYAEYQRKRRE